MKFTADFHIHSKYSRATSKDMDLESLDKWAKIKGIKVLGTGDFTHPEWFRILKEKLEPAEAGLFRLKKSDSPTRFILTSEISCIYSKKERVRKIHILIFAPSFEAVEKINVRLGWIGNLKADGRPILGLDAREALKIALDASEDCLVVPCHAWTPWFSIFGSKSGFNSIEECFDDYSKYIYAIETGLSSDPQMNWRLSALDKITLISNSDSHSPRKIGREANVFDAELNYSAITNAIKNKNPEKFLYTVEFFPEEGKYHYDGHRLCGVSLPPEETKKHKNICPKCKRPLTIGVLSRVEELADRPEGFRPESAIPFRSLVPLEEIIADAFGIGVGTKQVEQEYQKLIKSFVNEFNVLLQAIPEQLRAAALPEVAEGIISVREGRVGVEPGYDGVYGKVKIFSKEKKEDAVSQKTLF
ncbi:MAG: DNA helicase UvrD [Candidatus Wildermuthbacteria bacterium RIFCSPHIGHO2_01_FULL_47_27]|uniref:DNA helicase UvrD n=2 Tax=Candidatus Wildermuthiibacteriota TaxID=1817923 RepID=A0A1G2RMB6_9BACT|nr:MAG: PHP domain protein [Parcubacteria group bacterium GW2011_GWA2_47_9]OHA63502.1 MAG: DNA helicase UvrD [Candidatus Wildermuthbacteria bacterium RIFCSPHIGHO2_01_FULL_47_27]OHA67710.1 MAG: DNA helicase UvrD [Candidatus Wildermuthbacteria bacterium RIFCSPHIGHO2_02_FULL_47_17]OHA73990.1 MAG: DNA helicase UvrD [Candidatus Wildermuthbacteria bacterium RIFCSPLOWO2_01_FULL_48_35]OHA75591.1 MAG: DNA helicase UvrD [Candidatus Wildermuthbacteria bacterium RIFCSPLOWO2_02_FULL_47_10]